MKKFSILGYVFLSLFLIVLGGFLGSYIQEVRADLGDRWAISDDSQRDIVSIPTNPGAEYLKWKRQCTPSGTPATDDIWMYQRTKGGCENLMGKDDGGYEFQIGGANAYMNEGCNVQITGSSALEFGRGDWFNLVGGGELTGGFQTANVDDRNRRIMLIANQNTILRHAGNLDLGGCNLNMAAGRPHEFFCDGCRWHLIGHHNDF